MSTNSLAHRHFTCVIVIIACAFGIVTSTFSADDNTKAEALSKPEDPCEDALTEMVLKRVWKEGEFFYGAFEIRIATITDKPIVIGGSRNKRGFEVRRPSVSYEFRDANGLWQERLNLVGSFRGGSDTLSVTHREKAEIIAELPDTTSAERASEWKLVLRSMDNSTCMKSLPFKVKQKRGPVEGFVSDPEPDY